MTARNTWEKFWHRVEQSDGCWEWTGTTVRGGYGQFVINGRRLYAHRVAYELANGPVPKGMDVLHTCDNPPCVNPAHLRVGTHRENIADALEKRRLASKLTEEHVRQIRTIYAHRPTYASLAAQYGVTRETIGSIIQRRTWKHVE